MDKLRQTTRGEGTSTSASESAGLWPDANRCNGTALRKATRRVSQLYDEVLAPSGLRSTQRSLLVHIARADTPTMSELALALVLDRSALAQNLKPLERDGLVEVHVDGEDRRSRRIRLTPLGKKKLIEATELWERAQRRFENVFGMEKAGALRTSLQTIASLNFEQAFREASDD
jgi:DNA-binding MarR family transcriptional regulator